MEHRSKQSKFGRETKQRSAFIRSLAVAMIEREKIKTTETRAKALRPFVEKLITKGKKNTLANARYIKEAVGKESATKIIKELSPKFMQRAGGYLRIRRMVSRLSDGAKMVVIEFVS